MLTDKVIEQCLNESVIFLENSFLQIESTNNGEQHILWGFPQYRSKKRISEYGGTSSGISALYYIGKINPGIKEKLNISIRWLIEKQRGGAWEASEIWNCEVTAGILIDLVNLDILPENVVNAACDYILSCYDSSGYFKTIPNNKDEPHLYTTYNAVRALNECGKLKSEYKKNICQWIKSAMASDKLWGSEASCNSGTVAYTTMALLVLFYCDYGVKQIKADFKMQLTFLKKNTKGSGKLYENEETNIERGRDSSGICYKTLHTKHYVAPLMSLLFMNIGEERGAIETIMSIIKCQCAGGWGPAKDRLTMWATQQAIFVIKKFKDEILPNMNVLEQLTYNIPFFVIKAIVSILFSGITVYLLSNPIFSGSMVVSGFFAILPWLWERCYE